MIYFTIYEYFRYSKQKLVNTKLKSVYMKIYFLQGLRIKKLKSKFQML